MPARVGHPALGNHSGGHPGAAGSAGNRDAATHFAVLPVLAAVCFASHATQYALLIPEALLQRETMSTAERTVIDEFIMIQRTKVSPTPETLNPKSETKKTSTFTLNPEP